MSAVKHDGELLRWLEVASSTGQGDIQGTSIFNVCLNWAAQLAEERNTISKGLVLHEATEDLEKGVVMETDYADDMAILDGTKDGSKKQQISCPIMQHVQA